MKVLFSMRHPGALRNFSSTIRALADRGHHVHLSFVMPDKLGDGRLLWELVDDYPSVTHTELTKKTPYRFWLGLARAVRFWVDYLRYLEPEFGQATMLRERARQRLPRLLVGLSSLPPLNTRAGRRALSKLLLLVERAIPTDRWVNALIAAQAPDVVLVTPLVDLGSDQVDYVKSARAKGIPTGLCVHSWDNLTNKGLIRLLPDRVYVWNEMMKREAVDLHGMPADHVVVTGAPAYDQWFARRPATTREEFCAKTGLPVDRPFVLYLCSSAFIAPNEADFIVQWLRALRSAPDARLRAVAVLVRPHPENLQPWHRLELDEFGPVVVWPRGGANPVDAASKRDYYDSISHSVAAVGVNTSAQIEAGVVGRPVFTVRSEQHAGTQEGTLHFEYLLSAGGGLVYDARDFDEHVAQLARALEERPEDAEKLRRFVQAFVRPSGLDVEATPLLADGIEALGRLGVRGPRRLLPLPLAPLRWLLVPVAISMKIGRQFSRVSRKRQRQLRPLTFMGALLKPLFGLLDLLLRWQWAKAFIKRYVVPRVMPRMMTAESPTEEMVAVPRVIDRLSHGDRPIIVGPWLSEVGFEVLYWIPFLNWVKTYRPFDPERLIVVSRGGAGIWYRSITPRYVDLFDFFTPEQFRERNAQRVTEGLQKQRSITEFDREILKLVKVSIQRRDAEVLHPMYMYRLFHPYWKSQASANLLENFAAFTRLPMPDASDLDGALPERFVAVRFYFNDCFPETEDNRVFVRHLIERLSETTDVVLLNSGLALDDHWDFKPEQARHLHTVEHLMVPRNNLEVQTKIISRAQAFVGNYGGLSYVPPFYGVSSLAFYSRLPDVAVHHLELAHRVFSRMKRGSFVALDVKALDLVNLALGGLAAGEPAAIPATAHDASPLLQ